MYRDFERVFSLFASAEEVTGAAAATPEEDGEAAPAVEAAEAKQVLHRTHVHLI